MKALLFLSLTLAATAHADVTHFGITKSPDGKMMTCSSMDDFGRVGYRPLVTTLVAEGEGLRLDTAVANLVCAGTNGKFEFDAWLPYSPIPGHDIYGAPTTEILGQLKLLVTDAQSRILGSIDAGNVAVQALEYHFPLNGSFSRDDLARLDRGETLSVTWEIFQQGIHTVRRGGELIRLGLFTGGSYELSFDLRRNGGKLEVSSLQVR